MNVYEGATAKKTTTTKAAAVPVTATAVPVAEAVPAPIQITSNTFYDNIANVSGQTYILQLFYYVQPGQSSSSYRLAYIYHNLPPSFSVYFSNTGSTGGAWVYIQNKNINKASDTIKLLPISASKITALSDDEIKKSQNPNKLTLWNSNPKWSSSSNMSLITIMPGINNNCIVSNASNTPPTANVLQPPPSTTNITVTSSNGNTIGFFHNYDMLASSNQALSIAGPADSGFLNLANVELTFLSSICN